VINNKKAFVSWSGGKESCLSLFKSIRDFEIKYLLNMITEDGKYSRSHGIGVDLLKSQAEATGIPIIQRKTSWDDYEVTFKHAVGDLYIDAGIFGDIDLQGHRDWVERICKETGINPVLPLWNQKRNDLLNSFIEVGFKAIIITVNTKYMGKKWLGRIVDKDFIRDLEKLDNVDLAGEKGEYHTFVFDGPIFMKPVEFNVGREMYKDEYCFLEIFNVD
jgi:diphthine-ammonia ligase